jgi:hypothetical protein
MWQQRWRPARLHPRAQSVRFSRPPPLARAPPSQPPMLSQQQQQQQRQLTCREPPPRVACLLLPGPCIPSPPHHARRNYYRKPVARAISARPPLCSIHQPLSRLPAIRCRLVRLLAHDVRRHGQPPVTLKLVVHRCRAWHQSLQRRRQQQQQRWWRRLCCFCSPPRPPPPPARYAILPPPPLPLSICKNNLPLVGHWNRFLVLF